MLRRVLHGLALSLMMGIVSACGTVKDRQRVKIKQTHHTNIISYSWCETYAVVSLFCT